MERLKTNTSAESPEDGVLVTRADGTQAIKVRKRKRRSEQPIKEQQKQTRRARIVQVAGATIVLVFMIVSAGIALAYANSPSFRKGLLEKILICTGANSEIGTFRVNPRTANAGKLNLQWPKGNVLDQLALGGITATIAPSSFLGKAMTGEEIAVSDSKLTLQLPDLGQPLRAESFPEAELPISFNRYRTPNLDIVFGKDGLISLKKTEASLNFNAVTNRVQFGLNGGALTLPGWPKITLDRAFMEFQDKEINIISLNLLDPSGRDGMFEFSGTLAPYAPERRSTLAADVKNFPISGIIGSGLDKFFAGNIDSSPNDKSNFYSFYPSTKPAQRLSITFTKHLAGVFEVSKFPFLFALAQVLADDWFKAPTFVGENATGTIIREKDSILIQNLNLQSRGRMALHGDVLLSQDDMLSGKLELGVAENMMLAAADSPELKVLFSEPRDGYCWLEFDVSGTPDVPKDGFRELLLAAKAGRSKPDPAPDFKGSTFEELTKPR